MQWVLPLVAADSDHPAMQWVLPLVGADSDHPARR
jgi:hypothetical protein